MQQCDAAGCRGRLSSVPFAGEGQWRCLQKTSPVVRWYGGGGWREGMGRDASPSRHLISPPEIQEPLVLTVRAVSGEGWILTLPFLWMLKDCGVNTKTDDCCCGTL
ncbi:uncharacterized [Lates japonicus]